jgi:thioredoxin-related protein
VDFATIKKYIFSMFLSKYCSYSVVWKKLVYTVDLETIIKIHFWVIWCISKSIGNLIFQKK